MASASSTFGYQSYTENTNCQYRNKKRIITTDPTNSKQIINEHYEKLYTDEFYNLDEMNKFLKNSPYQYWGKMK